MILDFKDLFQKYSLNISGIIHVGAHYGEEYLTYKEHNISNILFFEPVPSNFAVLQKNIEKYQDDNVGLIPLALGNCSGKLSMNVDTENDGQSSSILEPDIHLKQYPHIHFNSKIEVNIVRLDDFMEVHQLLPVGYNFLYMDVQGYELEVLKGSLKTLNQIDYIMTEVNRDSVYKECAKIEEIDEFLSPRGFKRVETDWIGGTWGDAFYVKHN